MSGQALLTLLGAAFFDQSHFTNRFRAPYAVTPKACRKKWR